MKNRLFLVLCGTLLALFSASAVFAAPPKSGKNELQMQNAALEYQAKEAAAPPATEGKPPRTGLTVIPQYYFSGNSSLTTNLSDGTGGKLKIASGDAHGPGVIVLAAKDVTDWLTLGVMYQFISMDYSGGAPRPGSIPDMSIKQDLSVTSNAIAAYGDIDFGKSGRLNLSVLQGFQEYTGNQDISMFGEKVAKNNMDSFSDRITHLMAWYEFDIPLVDKLVLSPYAGWRSIYAHINNPQGEMEHKSDNTWVHVASGGLKLGYSEGLFGANIRAGVNQRLTHDDIPGFTVRATAPNTGLPGFQTHTDRTVATFGVGAHYVIPGAGVLFGGYDGFAGDKTNAHSITVGFFLPF